jgi:hypothetical protein
MPTTVTTFETLIRPQPNMQTLVAGLACVGRWYCNHLNSFFDAFVLKEGAQLIKRPRIRPPTLNLVSGFLVGAFSNPGQVFICLAVLRLAPTLAQALTAKLADRPNNERRS